jgi:hypothetical protein
MKSKEGKHRRELEKYFIETKHSRYKSEEYFIEATTLNIGELNSILKLKH